MQPSRILPDLQCSLLVEDIRQEANGKLMFIGILDVIPVPQLPVTAAQLNIVNRWTAGVGQFIESVRLLAPDTSTVLRKHEARIALPDAARTTTNVTVFRQVEFTQPGIYFVEVLVDEVMKLRYPLPVLVIQPPSPPPTSPPAAPAPAPAA